MAWGKGHLQLHSGTPAEELQETRKALRNEIRKVKSAGKNSSVRRTAKISVMMYTKPQRVASVPTISLKQTDMHPVPLELELDNTLEDEEE